MMLHASRELGCSISPYPARKSFNAGAPEGPRSSPPRWGRQKPGKHMWSAMDSSDSLVCEASYKWTDQANRCNLASGTPR
mmetsp:Transcript_16880/g.39793  ORF Transcript_16880/g.39793 Transcript_16880/m.39793 type:complete len:80 (-) Transcript_16880:9-248(-)